MQKMHSVQVYPNQSLFFKTKTHAVQEGNNTDGKSNMKLKYYMENPTWNWTNITYLIDLGVDSERQFGDIDKK